MKMSNAVSLLPATRVTAVAAICWPLGLKKNTSSVVNELAMTGLLNVTCNSEIVFGCPTSESLMMIGGPAGIGGGGTTGPIQSVVWKTVILVQLLLNTSGPIFKL